MVKFLELFGAITIETIVSFLIAFGFAAGALLKVFPMILDWYDKRKSDRRVLQNYRRDIEKIYQTMKENNDAINLTVQEIRDFANNTCQAQIETLNDNIRQKCRYYISLKYIPVDEIEDFKRMMETYKKIGGNHGLEATFNKTMELEVRNKEE